MNKPTRGRHAASKHPVRFSPVALKRAIKAAGTSVQTVQEALRLNGLTTQIYQHLSGTRTPSGGVVLVYAHLLNVPPASLYESKIRHGLDAAEKSLAARKPKGRPRKEAA